MRIPKGQDVEEVIELTVKITETIEDEGTKNNVYAVFSILAGERHSDKLIKKYVGREMLMKSTLFQEWVKEEREEAAINSAIINTRENTFDVLAERFDFVPGSISRELEEISDGVILN